MARLFFAAWPDPAGVARLEKLAAELAIVSDGKPVPRQKAHLTLVFLGEVSAERAQAATEVAKDVRFAPFALTLDCVGSFRGARVAWAGSLAPQVELARLQADLAGRLAKRGFVLEDRPFAPHATLARRIRKEVPRARIDPIAWTIDTFTLVRSETGTGRYEVMESFAAV
jgi:2'-5' RNA ligase